VDGGTPARRRPLWPKGDPGTVALQQSEQALAAEPTPGLVDAVAPTPATAGASASREKRRQRRRTRPHGRAR
jgi:hypothetical protein